MSTDHGPYDLALAAAHQGKCPNGYDFKTQCPNMKEREHDTSMTHEHYECKVCGAQVSLDYEEMK